MQILLLLDQLSFLSCVMSFSIRYTLVLKVATTCCSVANSVVFTAEEDERCFMLSFVSHEKKIFPILSWVSYSQCCTPKGFYNRDNGMLQLSVYRSVLFKLREH